MACHASLYITQKNRYIMFSFCTYHVYKQLNITKIKLCKKFKGNLNREGEEEGERGREQGIGERARRTEAGELAPPAGRTDLGRREQVGRKGRAGRRIDEGWIKCGGGRREEGGGTWGY